MRHRAILHRQQTTPSGVVALVDATGVIVGRTRDEASGVGTHVSPVFADLSSRSNEAAARLAVRDGTENYVAFSRSPRTGLVVGMGISAAEVDGPMLTHGLQGVHGSPLLIVPRANKQRPDPEFLAERLLAGLRGCGTCSVAWRRPPMSRARSS